MAFEANDTCPISIKIFLDKAHSIFSIPFKADYNAFLLFSLASIHPICFFNIIMLLHSVLRTANTHRIPRAEITDRKPQKAHAIIE